MLATVDMYMANIEQSDNMIALHNLSVNTKKQLLKEPGKFNVQVFYKIIDKKVMPCKRVTYPPSRASLLRSRGGGRTIVSQSTHLLAFATWVQEGAITLDD